MGDRSARFSATRRGIYVFAQGKFAAAHQDLERSVGLCEDGKAAAYLQLSGQDPRYTWAVQRDRAPVPRLFRSGVAGVRGSHPYGDTTHHPFSEAMARTISLRVHQLRGEAAVVASQADKAIALCEEHEIRALSCHGS